MKSGIYAWLNLVNGKVYVGSSNNLPRRKYHHTRKLKIGKHVNAHLQSAWNEYGESTFEFMILELVDDALWLRAREAVWISKLQAANREFGYNSSEDAWAPVTSEETKAKLRQAWVARKERGDYYRFTTEDQERSVAVCKGRRWSESQRKNTITARKPWTPERRKAQAERCRLQHHSQSSE